MKSRIATALISLGLVVVLVGCAVVGAQAGDETPAKPLVGDDPNTVRWYENESITSSVIASWNLSVTRVIIGDIGDGKRGILLEFASPPDEETLTTLDAKMYNYVREGGTSLVERIEKLEQDVEAIKAAP